jgi:hypothetical protein
MCPRPSARSWPGSFLSRAPARALRTALPNPGTGRCVGKAEKVVARALYRVVARNMAAGRSVAYDQLLDELAAEVDVLLGQRREHDVRLERQARKQLLEERVRLAAAEESRAAGAGDVEREFRRLDVTRSGLDEGPPGPPVWHPEHALNPENDL